MRVSALAESRTRYEPGKLALERPFVRWVPHRRQAPAPTPAWWKLKDTIWHPKMIVAAATGRAGGGAAEDDVSLLY